MNLLVEKQPRSQGTVDRLVSMLESMDHLTLTVITVPTPAAGGESPTLGDRLELLVNNGFEDDLANATWEDAEWQ